MVAMMFTFICGILLLVLSIWLSPISNAEEAAVEQDYERALENYALAEARLINSDLLASYSLQPMTRS